ncbi:dihydrolipoyl dehydrogenase [Leuconostoc litchii]|uniref:Dihydrolipoyl dehydrogenase n=1 Tax=Leuconostoc litchii TaxID=1981069 RepID=A0A6P2CME9_9LACO|nr:dihydrolipoyl dehydrogenase [Leuconostoc litchii]TYC47198.1 dihydrolipoyl dehydrogenase [Leuconostoc litchii]GMA69169.1 dihydrolipoyl dehydrogenase [Leuconostoc litchii]
MVVGAQARDVDTVVIGSGPGGYVAAIRAAELGQSVVIVERDQIGGVCLNVGCIPSKALINVGHRYREATENTPFGLSSTDTTLDWQQAQQWKQNKVVHTLTSGVEMLLKKHHIEIVRGDAVFNDNQTLNILQDDGHELLQFNNAIIATGSRPAEIPTMPFKGRVIDSTGALNLTKIPKRLIIVGGGVIGSEIGGAYANLGTEVTIVEGLDHTLNGFDAEMTKPVLDDFTEHGGTIITSATAKKATQTAKDVTLTYEVDGKEQDIIGDYLLVAVGRRVNTDSIGLNNTDIKVTDRGLIETNNQMQTSVSHIYAIGDVVAGPQLAHKASFEGKIAASAISEDPQAHDLHYSLPSVAYTQYELATTGETPETVKDNHLDAKISKFPFAANGRAISMDQAVGFVRLISDKKTNALIGGQIVGSTASDLISELSLAIENGLTIQDISLTIHPHPTFGEAIMDTAELADGLPIHI